MRLTLSLLLCLLVPFMMMGQAPVANFTSDIVTGCAPLTVNFKSTSTGNPISYYWTFEGISLSQDPNPQVSFPAGTYNITLTVKNADGINSITKTAYINSNPSPSANYTADKRVACAPYTVQFTDASVANAGTINKWEWTFEDPSSTSNTSGVQNAPHTYTTAGYYAVSLKVTSTTGCASQVNNARYIRIVNGVKADFSAVGPTTCQPPFSVLYKNLTSGPGNLTYTWDLGNGSTPATTSPTGIYPTGGSYTVKLTAQSDFGCSDAVQKTIPINGITTTFTSPASVCLGDAATFTSTSLPAPTKVLWKFGDGTTSDKPSFTKTYTNPGVYNVTLYSTFASCSDSLTKTITVGAKPTVAFTVDKDVSCKAPLTTTFHNTSPDFVTSNWDFGDGGTSTLPNPTHTFATGNKSYAVSLSIVDSKGCKNELTKSNFINIYPPVAQIGNLPAGVCVNQSFSPTSASIAVDGIGTFSWDFGDGTPLDASPNPTHSYSTPGTKTIKLSFITYDGCPASTTSTIQVGTPPTINFSASKTDVCHSDVVTFTNLSTPSTINPVIWNFGDGTTASTSNLSSSPPHKFPDSGYYNIKLIATSDGCTDSLTKPNFIHVLPPVANFGFTIPDCAVKTTVAFHDSTLNVDPPYGPLTYEWSFGDPANTKSLSNAPTFNYPSINTYNVRLIAKNNSCSDTIIKPIKLYDTKAGLTLNNKFTYCRNELINIFSINDRSFIKVFNWVIDGVDHISDQAVYPVTYPATGSHTAQLITTDIYGCNDTSATQNFSITGPTAKFTVANNGGCSNSIVTFNDASTTTAVLNKWIFDFGDGTPPQTFTGPPFTHKYTDTGSYTVKLTVYDNNSIGCSDTYTLPAAAVITKPVAGFGAEKIVYCPSTPLQFTDSSVGQKLTYSWFFGDGATSTLQNPTHPYPAKDSIYSVKLIVTDSVGCIDSLTRQKYISIRAPKLVYEATDTITFCPPLDTKFAFTGSDYESVLWNFGDGSDPSTLENTDHFYNTVGNYTAKLYAYGFGGCVDSASLNVLVLDPYAVTQLAYDPKSSCNELNVTFDLTAPANVKYQFIFGDGATIIDSIPQISFQHLYKLPNVYSPLILYSDKTGCQFYVGGLATIQINGAIPLFGINKKRFCDSGSVYFTDYSQQAQDPIIKKTWDFGDGSPTVVTQGDTTHYYAVPGLYVPALTVTTAAGCDKTYTDTVRVLATPSPVITSADAICNDLIIDFKGSLVVPPDTAIVWKWNLSNGIASDQQNVSLNYPDTGLHHIILEATNSLGCKGDTSKDIIVNPLPAITVAGDTSMISGAGGFVVPLTYSANATTFNWTPATYLSCTDCPNPFANPKFTTTYKLKVTDVNGCISNRNVTLVVLCNDKNFFIPNTFSPNNDGANDRFYPRGKGLDHIQALRIFNRWGELVFEKRNFPANDAASGWDGMYKGKTASSDTYVYMIDIICENANIITYKGNVTLIR